MLLKKKMLSKKPLLAVLLLFVLVASCKHKQRKKSPAGFTDEALSEKLESILKPVDTAGGKKISTISEYVRLTYQGDDYQPIWIKENYSASASATKLIDELEEMEWDGFAPERYNLAAIKLLKIKLDTTKVKDINDVVRFDTTLTHSYLSASKDLLFGTVIPKKVDSLWYHVNDTVWNASQVLAEAKNGYTPLDSFRSKVPTYSLLRNEYRKYSGLAADTSFMEAIAAVHYVKNPDSELLGNINYIIKSELPWLETVENDTISEQAQLVQAYQRYRALKPTGKLDSATVGDMTIAPADYMKKIRANMERVRWMQREFGSLYLVVDIPLMELFLRRDGINLMHMNVVVGKTERQTPALFANMANVVINPPWGVPPTILKNDVVPGFQKSGKQYLAKKGLKAYDRQGNVVNSSRLNINNLKKYTYKQDPGDDNSLGYVKFNLPNKWDIYLHDTPHRLDFEKRYRALSSGCIRLHHPQEMAIFILSELEKRDYTQEKLTDMIETHKTRWEILKNKIPVHITYLTAFEDTTGKHLQFTRDIYHRDDKLMAVMN